MRTEPKPAGPVAPEPEETQENQPAPKPAPAKLTLADFGPRLTPSSQLLVAKNAAGQKPFWSKSASVPPKARHSDANRALGALQDQSRTRPEALPTPARSTHPDAAAVRSVIEQQSRPPVPPPPTRPTKPAPQIPKTYPLLPADGSPQPPVEMQFEAYKRLAALTDNHERLVGAVDAAIGDAQQRVTAARTQRSADEARGVFREGIADAVWAAERDVKAMRDARRELGEKYGAAKHELERIVGRTTQTAAGPGKSPGPVTSFKSFDEKFAAYNRSISSLKSGGLLGAVGIAGYALAVELGAGQRIGHADRQRMDRISAYGSVIQAGARAAAAQRRPGVSGALSPAPGVDQRREGLSQSAAELWQARVPRAHSAR